MRINRITLINFGSYEGENSFDTKADKGRNIVLIGGKNGSGKTTLFVAMRVCLYGFLSMGYKSANSYYNRSIIKLINNNVKMNKPCFSSISIEIELNNGRGVDNYIVLRKWTLADILSEEFEVTKNGVLLGIRETADFEKYILSLVPPELFNLYFFDGENIADFFLKEGSNTRIKDAFLTLCGYDTFDIMRKNFKRMSISNKGKTRASLSSYIKAREQVQKEKETIEKIQNNLFRCTTEIENCSADITLLDREYANSGGITQEEWNHKIFLLKDEERKRENWNAILRKWANESIPFIMVSSILERVKDQIVRENDKNKLNGFIEILSSAELVDIIGQRRDAIEEAVLAKYGTCESRVLDLSFEQSASLMAKVSDLLAFDRRKVVKAKSLIKQSINRSVKLRKELEQSNVSTVQDYMRLRAELFEKKSDLLDQQLMLEQLLQKQRDGLSISSRFLSKAQASLEEEIKKKSISDISVRAIVMLDKLQEDLYKRQIKKVESEFKRIIRMLMRKSRFIDDIYIDGSFNTHVFRNEEFLGKTLKDIISANTEEQFTSMFGVRALQVINDRHGTVRFEELSHAISDHETFVLPVEIDKESFSNGEKQIFIMALYYSLVQLGNHEIPFIIDTPFARIDTEHRKNITKYFFSKLKGQVFIFSTNEEVTSEHVQILQDKILAQYMLENTDNKKTVVVKDMYFEV